MTPKFRAYDGGSLNRMYQPDEVMVGNGDIWIIDEDSVTGEWIVNNDIHLMQSTGLLDKNGKEIFEGDIVDYKGRKAVIKWHGSYASFIYIFVDELQKRVAGWSPLYLAYFHFEVIGNKFETPEFLEVEE
ncbi:MAG: YopX family protein [Streptococcus mitis]|uniref:YopX protein n=1 Tax=Streptococcus mitis TaxID=28037 RepID=A0A3R9T7U2_STRMT|nr:YopX family protein [Streptococcus mitis]MDU3712404.1 YopX family protein [Streptococcus mitis]RSJ94835.1 YopX protein [Streptococcus mitis]